MGVFLARILMDRIEFPELVHLIDGKVVTKRVIVHATVQTGLGEFSLQIPVMEPPTLEFALTAAANEIASIGRELIEGEKLTLE